MGKSLVVKDPKRGPAWSLTVLAAGIVAVGTFLWLTAANSNEHEVTPSAQPAALALSAHNVDLTSYCGSSENGPVEVDYQRLDTQGVDSAPVDLALAQGQGGADYSVVSAALSTGVVTTAANAEPSPGRGVTVDYQTLDALGIDRTAVDLAVAALVR